MLRILDRIAAASGLENYQRFPRAGIQMADLPPVRKIERDIGQRLQFLRAAIICNADDWYLTTVHITQCHAHEQAIARMMYLCLLDKSTQRTDAASVTRGHTVHLIHDQAGLVCDCHAHSVLRL